MIDHLIECDGVVVSAYGKFTQKKVGDVALKSENQGFDHEKEWVPKSETSTLASSSYNNPISISG